MKSPEELRTCALEDKLHRLCKDGNVRDLREYLDHGITASINHRDAKSGDTPLHHAARAKKNSQEMTR